MIHVRKLRAVGALFAAGGVFLDLFTKEVALTWLEPGTVVELLPFLNLRLAFNTGVSFGILKDALGSSPLVVAALSSVVVLGFVTCFFRTTARAEVVGLAFIVGGAVANIIDRVMRGAVVDFVDLHVSGYHWPTFNLADVFIVGGCASLVLPTLVGVGGYSRDKHSTDS